QATPIPFRMPFRPEITYDAEHKVWSSDPVEDYFAPHLSIGQIIFHEMRRHPKLVAQISDTENTVLHRDELLQNSMRVASYMRKLGLKQSDVVGIIARNTTHISAVAYGCFFNGIAFHALNMNYEEATIEKLFGITKPCLIFCDGDEYLKIKSATKSLNVKIVTMREHHKDSISINEVLASAVEPNFEPAHLEKGNDQTLAILCSSGTTGTPKAVTISNSRKIFSCCTYLTTSDVQYSHSSLDWITGLSTTVISGVFSTLRVIADNAFEPARLLRIIEKYRVTWVMQAPSHMAMIVSCPEFAKANFESIQYHLYGGTRCSLEVQHQIRSRLSRDCLQLAYGFSEAGSMVSTNWNFDEKPNSVGRLVQGYKAKIINEQGENCGPNEVGELCINSGQFWAGYYGNPEESQKIRDSELWFHTGDLAYIDDDGFLYIVERKKDMLKFQSIMYYPNEIEEVISQMPDVAEVCVFGVWDQFNGDEAAAAVVKKKGSKIEAQDVVDYVRNKIGAKYKHLHAGAIIVDDLKRSPNGKPNRVATKAYFLLNRTKL
ncbi:hypothetical protein KR222_006964, partial [Zaprionus bogoriensis]